MKLIIFSLFLLLSNITFSQDDSKFLTKEFYQKFLIYNRLDSIYEVMVDSDAKRPIGSPGKDFSDLKIKIAKARQDCAEAIKNDYDLIMIFVAEIESNCENFINQNSELEALNFAYENYIINNLFFLNALESFNKRMLKSGFLKKSKYENTLTSENQLIFSDNPIAKVDVDIFWTYIFLEKMDDFDVKVSEEPEISEDFFQNRISILKKSDFSIFKELAKEL